MNILVTGGSGLVGKALQDICKNYKYNFTFLSSNDGDLANYNNTFSLFKLYKPDYVIHLAANVGGLYKNINSNIEMFETNIMINMNVLKSCYNYKVKKCISILSTCIFPDKTEYPINEDMLHLGDPHESNIGYSYAKRMLEVQSRIYREKYSLDFSCIIPTNIYGKHDNFNLENSHVIPSLIHQCYLSKIYNTPFTIRGSGKPLRQFLYSTDLAILIMNILSNGIRIDNIIVSPSKNISIKELSELIKYKMDNQNDIIYDKTFNDGQYKKTADNRKLLALFPDFKFTNFENGLEITINWFLKNYDNLRK